MFNSSNSDHRSAPTSWSIIGESRHVTGSAVHCSWKEPSTCDDALHAIGHAVLGASNKDVGCFGWDEEGSD